MTYEWRTWRALAFNPLQQESEEDYDPLLASN